MKLPPFRYPGYSLRRMVLETYCSDKAAGALRKVLRDDRRRAPIGDKHRHFR